MQTIRSPFFIIEDAISPAKCELLIKELGLSVPSVDENGRPLKNERFLKGAEALLVQSAITYQVQAIEERFGGTIKQLETPIFQQYFENPGHPAAGHSCDNSRYLRRKWTRVKDTDLVGYLWLKDYNSGVPLDPRFEVYGGKLELPAYDFSLLPQRGTMVVFPGTPHFVTAVSPILVGSLEMVKISVKLHTQDGTYWQYVPENFPGTYQEWFTAAD